MNKTYKIQLPRNKEAQNIRTNIKDGTIEVEVELKEKWEPKDGEICFVRTTNSYISVFKSKDRNRIHTYIDFCVSCNLLIDTKDDCLCFTTDAEEFRPATDCEKQLLFDALAKEGKMWDAQKKAVVDLPKPQLEVKECPTSLEKDIDWEERRYEIAKQMLTVTSDYREKVYDKITTHRICCAKAAKYAVGYADALIAELKKGGDK